MRNFKEIPVHVEIARDRATFWGASEADALASELDTNGIVVLPNLLTAEQLHDMQFAFATRLRRMRWNNVEGYQKTERYRHMVEHRGREWVRPDARRCRPGLTCERMLRS